MSASEALDQWPSSRVGEVLAGRYELLRHLSTGGMGVVYDARHVIVGRRFAVKLLHPECASRPGFVTRFEQEAKAVGSLASEHIVAVLDFGRHRGTPFFVMELLQGKDLRELLFSSGPLPVPRAVAIALDVCKGLHVAHAAGLIHRDLKPANIFVTEMSKGRERAKILDFGIAKWANATGPTGEGTLIGTVGYMAPEQIHSGKSVDQRADVYSLGVVLYEMLAGTPAFQGEKAEVLFRVLHDRPTPLHQLRHNLPKGLAAIIDRATAKDVERRYRTIGELADALSPYAYPGGATVAHHPPLTSHSDQSTVSTTSVALADIWGRYSHGLAAFLQRRRWSRWQPLPWLLLIGTLAVLGHASVRHPAPPQPSLTNAASPREITRREAPLLAPEADTDVSAVEPGPHVRPAPAVSAPAPGLPGRKTNSLSHDSRPGARSSVPRPRARPPAAASATADPPAPMPTFDAENPYGSPRR